jgi:hypothetical protein
VGERGGQNGHVEVVLLLLQRQDVKLNRSRCPSAALPRRSCPWTPPRTRCAALEALPTVDGAVTVHRDGPLPGGFGLFRWRVTFRGKSGDLSLLAVDLTQLSGTAAHTAVSELQASPAHALTRDGPRLDQARKNAGLPYYVGTYTPQNVGAYQLVVRQLTKGGLRAQLFDNQWLQSNSDGREAGDWSTVSDALGCRRAWRGPLFYIQTER